MSRCLALLLVLAAIPAVGADDPSFEAMGRAPIAGGDRVRARERALDDAFQHAIEGAIGALLGADRLVKKAADLRLKIMPRARSYVQSFRVLDEGEHEAGVFSVQISAEIAADRLLRELSDKSVKPTKQPANTNAKLLICGGNELKMFAASVRTRLAKAGFDIVAGARCDEAELASSGARGGLIIDASAPRPAPIRGTSLVGVELKLSLRLVDSTAKRWAEDRADAVGYGATPDAAIDTAAMQVLPELMATIEPALSPQDLVRGGLSVRVLGVRRYPQLAGVRSALERLPGVDAVEPRRFNPGVPGSIEIYVRTALPVRAVVDGLRRVSATYQFNVREIDGAVVVDVPETSDPGAVGSGTSPQ